MANPRRGSPVKPTKVKKPNRIKATDVSLSAIPTGNTPVTGYPYPSFQNCPGPRDSQSSLSSDSDGSVCYSSTEIDIDDNPCPQIWDDGATKRTRAKCCPKKCSPSSSDTCSCSSDPSSCSAHHGHCPVIPLCPPYVQDGFLSYFDPSRVSTVPIAQKIDFARRQSIDFWLRDPTGIWHQPGDFLANYAIQVSPGLELGLYTISVVLPANTVYIMGSAYSLVITFRSKLLEDPEGGDCENGQCGHQGHQGHQEVNLVNQGYSQIEYQPDSTLQPVMIQM